MSFTNVHNVITFHIVGMVSQQLQLVKLAMMEIL